MTTASERGVRDRLRESLGSGVDKINFILSVDAITTAMAKEYMGETELIKKK